MSATGQDRANMHKDLQAPRRVDVLAREVQLPCKLTDAAVGILHHDEQEE